MFLCGSLCPNVLRPVSSENLTLPRCTDQDHNGDVIVEFPDINPSDGPLAQPGDNLKRRRWVAGNEMRHVGITNKMKSLMAHKPHLWYSPAEAVKALGLLLSSADELGSEKTYRCVDPLFVSELYAQAQLDSLMCSTKELCQVLDFL